MKLSTADRLPIQDLLPHKALTVMPLETYASELSEVPHSHDAYMVNSFLASKGGHWAWTAGLRSFFLVLLLVALLAAKGKLKQLLWVMRQKVLQVT